MSDERVRRPPPERQGPIRNWWTLFAPPAGAASPGAAGDPIARGVEAGYRVIEDYLRRGQEVARGVPPWASLAGMGVAPPTGAEDLQRRMAPLLRMMTEAATMWMSVLGASPPGFAASAPPPPPGVRPFTDIEEPVSRATQPPATSPPTAHATHDAPTIEIALPGPRAVTVSIYLRPGAASGALSVNDLIADGAGGERLSGVALIAHDEDGRVEVRLPALDGLAAGCYRGVIIDAGSSVARGMLSVRIAPTDR